ncbi:MAG TPA: hypothetical protein VFU88_22255 [Ktedonobacterales bacterium]|nr:hypothetical protein [Ktedonobacterales bacterium]
MSTAGALSRQALRTPRAAAIAGVLFALSLGASLVLFRLAIPTTGTEALAFLANPATRRWFFAALYLVPFSGIAFLWFMGVVRDRMGALEDRFFASVFLGSGLLFLALLFMAAAIASGLVATIPAESSSQPVSDTWKLSRNLIYSLVSVYAMRMAAVFIISTSTIALRIAILPRWLGFLGYACALVLLVTAGSFPWVELLFPFWVLLVSVFILVASWHAKS